MSHEPFSGMSPLRFTGPSVFLTAIATIATLAFADRVHAQDIFLGGGAGLYESDELCIDPDGSINSYRLEVSGSSFGVSGSYEDEDWPWPEPPPGSGGNGNLVAAARALALGQGQPVALRHGSAFQILAQAYPIALLRGERLQLGEAVEIRPFVGGGLHVSQDGDAGTDGPNGVDVYGVKGTTAPIFSLGSSLILGLGDLPLAIQAQYRWTSLFTSDVEFLTPNGDTVVSEGSQTLSWGELTLGVNLRLGG